MLEFNEDRHEYKLDGIIVPSVTQVIKTNYLVDLGFVADDVLERACYIGKGIHRTVELLEKKELNLEKLDDFWKPYLEAWMQFKEEYAVKTLHSELKIYSKKHMYAGTLDIGCFLFESEDKTTIIDIKHGSTQRTYALQTAAYARAYEEMNKLRPHSINRLCVYLGEDGTYKVNPYKDKNDINVFLGALTVANWRTLNNYRVARRLIY